MSGPTLLACLLLAAAAGPAQEPTDGGLKAYHAARIYAQPGSESPFVEDAWLLVEAGRVRQILTSAAELPPLTPVEDLGEAVVIPGLVAASTTEGTSPGSGDYALGAHRLALDDFDLHADMEAVLSHGITTFYVSPDRERLVGGRGAVVKAAGGARVLIPAADLCVSLRPEAFNPPHFYRPPIPPTSDNPIEPAVRQPASSRAGALMALRESARDSLAAGADVGFHERALAEFLTSKQPLRFSASTAGEVSGAVALAQEWGVPFVVDGGSEAWRLADRLAAADGAVVFGVPLFLSMPDSLASWEAPERDSLRRLREEGVPVALGVSHGDWRWLLEAAAAAVGYGMNEGDALAAVTHSAAHILGVADRVGALAPGCDADFVVLSSDPLEGGASVQRVFVEGREVWDARARVAATARAGSVVIRAGSLWTGDGPPLHGGAEVLLRDGKVAAVGPRVPRPEGARVVDAGPDAHLAPGFIDALGHLGTDRNERIDDRLTLGWLAGGSAYDAEWLAVARAGVTTMVVSPDSASKNGQRLQAAKTAARGADDAFVKGRELVRFDASGGDRAALADRLRDSLRAGKAYFEKWQKYRADRAKWEAEQGEKSSQERTESEAALRERLAKGAEKKEEKPEAEEEDEQSVEVEEEQVEADPLNGKWEAVLEDPRLPEPITLLANVVHEGTRVTAVLSSPQDPSGQTFEIEGTYNHPNLNFEITVDFGVVTVTSEIDAPDHMNCRLELAGMGSLDFEAVRIETGEGLAKIAPRRRLKKDDGPQPPKRNWGLEGQRALFEGHAVALVEANRADEIRTAVEVFGEYELPLQILGGAEAHLVADLLRDGGIGVVVPPELVQQEEERTVVPAARLEALGVRTAFQSRSRGGARFLPQALALATRFGLSPQQALEGVTSEAAELLGLTGRVGRLAPGWDGDVVILSGPPFDLRTQVVGVFVNGREVPQE